jgi:HD-GYP domain-containing protein (c-di-GMP phosphodiesterase class II)
MASYQQRACLVESVTNNKEYPSGNRCNFPLAFRRTCSPSCPPDATLGTSQTCPCPSILLREGEDIFRAASLARKDWGKGDPGLLAWYRQHAGFSNSLSLEQGPNHGPIKMFEPPPSEPRPTLDRDTSAKDGFPAGLANPAEASTPICSRFRCAQEDTIYALECLSEIRDPYNAIHQRRVAELSVAIAHELDLPSAKIWSLHLAALVHDIGKIGVPLELLAQPRRLLEVEFALIKRHPETGFRVLQHLESAQPIARIVLEHHERLDGSGYPFGLHGEQIMLESRIVMVADVVDAISSHRPYRPSKGLNRALEEIARGAGTTFQPDIVDACICLFRENRFRWHHGRTESPPRPIRLDGTPRK